MGIGIDVQTVRYCWEMRGEMPKLGRFNQRGRRIVSSRRAYDVVRIFMFTGMPLGGPRVGRRERVGKWDYGG